MLSPYEISDPALASQSALMSFNLGQIVAAANALWNLYAMLDDPQVSMAEVRDRANLDRRVIETVHASLSNCHASLEAMAKVKED